MSGAGGCYHQELSGQLNCSRLHPLQLGRLLLPGVEWQRHRLWLGCMLLSRANQQLHHEQLHHKRLGRLLLLGDEREAPSPVTPSRAAWVASIARG